MSPRVEQLRGFRCPSAAAGVWHSRDMCSKPQESISVLREALQIQDKERVQRFGRCLDINSWSPDKDTRLTTPHQMQYTSTEGLTVFPQVS